jgi:hypothetical protein
VFIDNSTTCGIAQKPRSGSWNLDVAYHDFAALKGGISERDLFLVQIDALQRQAELAMLRGDSGLARARLDLMISGGR